MRQTSPIFRLTIKLDNDAFQDGNEGPEVARILRDIADTIDTEASINIRPGKIRDSNGNSVGIYTRRNETLT